MPTKADRRGFLRQALSGAIEQAARITEERIVTQRPIRPPGALPELGFLGACTRCGKCVEACPPQAIRVAGPESGLGTGTPYLDPGVAPCEACADMPCAASCPTGALTVPATGWRGVRFGRIRFHPERCITFRGEACALCVQACPVGSPALALDADGRPVLKIEGCVGCGMCVRACPTLPSSMVMD